MTYIGDIDIQFKNVNFNQATDCIHQIILILLLINLNTK